MLPGGVHLMCQGPRSPGWAGGSLGLRGGLPSPPPLPGGAGAPRAGWEVPGAAAAPRPSRRSGYGPGRGSARPRGSLRACHFLPGREGGGCRPGAAGRAGGGGWRGGASGAAGPLPRPTPSPRRPPSPPSARPSFPAGARCHDDAAPGPQRSWPRGFFVGFPPHTLARSLFFSFFLSEFCSPVGGTKLSWWWPLVGNSPLTEEWEMGGKWRERGKNKVFFGSF